MTLIRPGRLLRAHAAMALALLLFSGQASAQDATNSCPPGTDRPFGERNESAPPGLARYDFLIGDWDADVSFNKIAGGTINFKARWHNTWISNGYVVQQEWRGPYTTGVEFRSYDPREEKWLGQNIYFNKSWKATEIEFDGGKMIVYITQAEDQNGPFLARETYYDITQDSFKIRSDRSDDGGETWQPGAYVIEARRVTEKTQPSA